MHYTMISLTSLKTYEDCDRAIQSIENDHRNVIGGSRSWFSGYATELLKGAEKKIQAIEKRQSRLFEKEVKEEYKKMIKRDPDCGITWDQYWNDEMYC